MASYPSGVGGYSSRAIEIPNDPRARFNGGVDSRRQLRSDVRLN